MEKSQTSAIAESVSAPCCATCDCWRLTWYLDCSCVNPSIAFLDILSILRSCHWHHNRAEPRAASYFQRDSKLVTAISVAFFALLGCASWDQTDENRLREKLYEFVVFMCGNSGTVSCSSLKSKLACSVPFHVVQMFTKNTKSGKAKAIRVSIELWLHQLDFGVTTSHPG